MTRDTEHYFLVGGGESGELIQNHNWAATSLGAIDTWPACLRTTLANMLHSAFPMFLFWGPELISFYNDAYRPSLGEAGKHPAIGKYGRDLWPEIWDFIGPLIDDVIASGKPSWFEDQLLPIYRNGTMEDVYWTFSYSPSYGDDGTIRGVLVTCMETTDSVRGRKLIEETVAKRTEALARANASLADAYTYLQAVTDLSQEALQILSPVKENGKVVDFRFHHTNANYAAYANTTPEALVNRLVGEVFPSYFETSSFTNVVRVYESGISDTWEIHYDKDGLDLYNVMSAVKLGDEVVLHFTDVTQERRLHRELTRKIEELAHSNARLEEFAHAASHDMKEPIRKIIVFTGKLKGSLSGRLAQQEADLLSRIEKAASRMAQMVDDLLKFSEASVHADEKEAVDLSELIRQVTQDLELHIQDKGATISFQQLPVVQGYSRQLQQLCQNLISNSLKYSKADLPPRVSITSGIHEDGNGRYHEIRVADNGIGFEQEYSEKIFQMFERLHGRHEYSGTGIGLSIVKKVMDIHNGTIDAHSTPGSGTTFTLLLPVGS